MILQALCAYFSTLNHLQITYEVLHNANIIRTHIKVCRIECYDEKRLYILGTHNLSQIILVFSWLNLRPWVSRAEERGKENEISFFIFFLKLLFLCYHNIKKEDSGVHCDWWQTDPNQPVAIYALLDGNGDLATVLEGTHRHLRTNEGEMEKSPGRGYQTMKARTPESLNYWIPFSTWVCNACQ